MRILNLGDQQTASRYVAIELIKLLQDKPDAILGLATGATMTSVYPYFTDLLDLNHIDVSQVHTFNLDEYVGLDAHHEHSYHHYMHERYLTTILAGIKRSSISQMVRLTILKAKHCAMKHYYNRLVNVIFNC